MQEICMNSCPSIQCDRLELEYVLIQLSFSLRYSCLGHVYLSVLISQIHSWKKRLSQPHVRYYCLLVIQGSSLCVSLSSRHNVLNLIHNFVLVSFLWCVAMTLLFFSLLFLPTFSDLCEFLLYFKFALLSFHGT